ncbi:sporulation protein, YlmC/YmxH family [Caloramator quimbayensis]|uniref:Sporulation protein, YlmC/YmxH family n=1 Tax=Caloramator quimbayensis TaxID=1147123 RepID=A0A1T4X1N7_9CLOT|nr:YlmC/YmxH family sporulation protein [Caloramator quimbayensis]SKA83504.1 sporulation protein, YlmC/YmxH family [Caloramator quimbayensis]
MKDRYETKNTLTTSDLRQMEVIDISEGKRLGFISDIIFDDDLKRIESIVIPPQNNFLSVFRKKDEIQIKWSQIKVIGIDVILVDTSSKNANDEKDKTL